MNAEIGYVPKWGIRITLFSKVLRTFLLPATRIIQPDVVQFRKETFGYIVKYFTNIFVRWWVCVYEYFVIIA